jgi:hypothetical protein
MRKTIRESHEGGGRRKGERWGLAAAFLAAARTSGDRSGGDEGRRRRTEVGGGGGLSAPPVSPSLGTQHPFAKQKQKNSLHFIYFIGCVHLSYAKVENYLNSTVSS